MTIRVTKEVQILSIGTLLEWAEFTFYAYIAPLLSSLFFPENHPHVALIKTYGIFAAGHLTRPLGGLLFGYIGDQYGRKPALIASLTLMGIATCSIGCLPTYERIGYAAPLLLFCCRLLQGIALSGEFHGAGILLTERVKATSCLPGSWICASAAAGMVLGGIAALIVGQFPTVPLAWRIPFLLSGMTCFIALWLRTKLMPCSATSHPMAPLYLLFTTYKTSCFYVTLIAIFTGAFVYIGNIFYVGWLTQYTPFSLQQATLFALFGETLAVLLIPIMARWADTFSPYPFYLRGLALTVVLFPCIYCLSITGDLFCTVVAVCIFGILNGILSAPLMKILVDQFPMEIRYRGIAFTWGLATACCSGMTPFLAQYCISTYQWPLAPSFYVSFLALITWVAMRVIPASSRIPLFAQTTIKHYDLKPQ